MWDRGAVALMAAMLFVFAASHLYALNLACYTYHATPDDPNFQLFLEPSGQAVVGKIRYFFDVFGFSLVVILFVPILLSRSEASYAWTSILFGALFMTSLMAVVIVSFHATLAESATRAHGWHGHSAPNSDIDGICKAAEYFPRIFGFSFE